MLPVLAAQLENIQKQYNMFDGELARALDEALMPGVDFAGLQFQNGVLDGPTLTSRAGLYIYLNALVRLLLVAQPEPVLTSLACWATAV